MKIIYLAFLLFAPSAVFAKQNCFYWITEDPVQEIEFKPLEVKDVCAKNKPVNVILGDADGWMLQEDNQRIDGVPFRWFIKPAKTDSTNMILFIEKQRIELKLKYTTETN